MLRMTSCVTIAFLLTVVAGCGEPEASVDKGQSTNEPANSPAMPETAESKSTSVKESQTLKQAMVDATAELMKGQQPEIDMAAIRNQVEKGILQIRKDFPEFLMVSVETENRLQSDTQIEGAAKSIADAEAFLNEYGIQLGGLTASLLIKHKAGNLSPVSTELLAQLIVADKAKAEKALGN